METNVKLRATDGEPLEDPIFYIQLVGSLIYWTISRPDIAYAVHLVSQFMSAPRSVHWAAVIRIMRYVREIHLGLCLLFSADSAFELRAYSDSDYGGSTMDGKKVYGRLLYFDWGLLDFMEEQKKAENSPVDYLDRV